MLVAEAASTDPELTNSELTERVDEQWLLRNAPSAPLYPQMLSNQLFICLLTFLSLPTLLKNTQTSLEKFICPFLSRLTYSLR